MKQAMAILPENATIRVTGEVLKIRDHQVANGFGMFEWSLWRITSDKNLIALATSSPEKTIWGQVITEMKNEGVSFAAFRDTCVRELVNNYIKNVRSIMDHYEIKYEGDKTEKYLCSDSARKIATKITEKIKRCDRWDKWYNIMEIESDFAKEMKNTIIDDLKNCKLL